jgi:hypothetical protein
MGKVPGYNLNCIKGAIPLPLFNIEIRTTGSRDGRSGSSEDVVSSASEGFYTLGGFLNNYY